MSNKQLDTTNIVNELKGGSLFFREDKPKNAKTPAKATPTAAVVPLPTTSPSKTVSYLSPPLPSPPQPSQGLTTPLPSATLPPSNVPSSESHSAFPAPSAGNQHQGDGDGTTVRPDERTTVPSTERIKVRHTFDILSDQLFALRELAVERERTVGRKVLLGDLVQEALDLLLSRERNHDSTNEATFDRPNERTTV